VLAARLDWAAVGAALVTARWPLVALAAALTLTHLGLRAVRWRLMLGRDAPPLGTLLWAYAVGVAAGLAVPASGEFTRALLLARHSGQRTTYLLGSVAVEKLLDMVAVLLLLAVGLWQAPRLMGLGVGVASKVIVLLVFLVVATALLLAVVMLAARRGPPGWLPSRLARAWMTFGVALAEAWVRFAGGVAAVLRLPRGYQAAVGALTLLVWGNACLLTMLALAAFDLPADWALAAVLYGTLLVGLSAPSAPGGIGVYELAAVAVLQGFGLPLAPSAAFAIAFHALTFVPPLLVGAFAFLLRQDASNSRR
jgi:uncharacterized protein (TIRG00374 family)